MDLAEIIDKVPHLASPAHLARVDSNGKWQIVPHLAAINAALIDVASGVTDRLMVFVPFQHGKTVLCSHYFPAWILLLFPHMRIVLASYSESYSASFGGKVREVVQRFGPELGINLKADTKSKNEWKIEGHEGGMICKGRHGGLSGRPCDLLIMDDCIKDAAEAMSASISDATWDWYQTVAYSRLGPKAPIVIVNTRWAKNDLCRRILEEEKNNGGREQWKVIKFRAIAGDNDILGRKPGEALWPERVPLDRLLMIREQRGRWFETCWNQEPSDEHGQHFRPRSWPHYVDTGDAYIVEIDGEPRQVVLKDDVLLFITVDWAWSVKASADHTAIGVFALTPDGRMLILEMTASRFRPEELAPALAKVCRKWRPALVAVESGHPTLANGYRRHPEIPEIRWLKVNSKDKLFRALTAINWGENGRIHLPKNPQPWQEAFVTQLIEFTGINDDADDMVDALAWAGHLAEQMRGMVTARSDETWPQLLVAGREDF